MQSPYVLALPLWLNLMHTVQHSVSTVWANAINTRRANAINRHIPYAAVLWGSPTALTDRPGHGVSIAYSTNATGVGTML